MGKRFVLTVLLLLVSAPFVASSGLSTVGLGLGLAGLGVYAAVESAARVVSERLSL